MFQKFSLKAVVSSITLDELLQSSLLKRSIPSFLAIICIASALFFDVNYLLIFPFIPIQITLIDQFVEGFPPFVLTFERNIKPVEKHFLKRSLAI